MKKFTPVFILLALAFVFSSVVCFAQEVATSVMPTTDFLKLLIESIGGVKGASSLGIAFIVVKVILAFMDSEIYLAFFSKVKGGVKLTIVLGLSMISGVLSLMVVGDLPLGAALIHSSTLSMLVVFSNQVYKQYFEKKAA